MFEFLDNATIQNAFPASHHAIQIIRKQWSFALRNQDKIITDGLNSTQSELLNKIIKEIETVEGKPITELSLETIDKYINILVERLEQLSRQELNVNQSVGKNLLNQLRASDVGILKR
jgi:vacuolar-type H+-ATPase subunit E/Vma4